MKTINDILNDAKFPSITENDKAFIIAFDDAMNGWGYDFGGKYAGKLKFYEAQITYAKTGTKSRTPFARITIQKDHITLRFYFKDIDKHRTYIESASAHIKAAFVFEKGDCISCNPKYCTGKNYTIDGQTYFKCLHSVGHLNNPAVERLPDYMALLAEFYPARKPKVVK